MDRCPMSYLDQKTIRVMRFYRFFEMGWLPNPGGILDQPATFVEAVECIRAAIAKEERERADESRAGGHPKIPR